MRIACVRLHDLNSRNAMSRDNHLEVLDRGPLAKTAAFKPRKQL
jgi:hypothetical protein